MMPSTFDLEKVEYVHLVGSGFDDRGVWVDDWSVKIDGRSLEKIAEDEAYGVYALERFYRFEGTAEVNGESISISSTPFGRSPRIYVKGRVLSYEEVLAKGWAYGDLAEKMKKAGWTHAIKYRRDWHQFSPENGETVLTRS